MLLCTSFPLTNKLKLSQVIQIFSFKINQKIIYYLMKFCWYKFFQSWIFFCTNSINSFENLKSLSKNISKLNSLYKYLYIT